MKMTKNLARLLLLVASSALFGCLTDGGSGGDAATTSATAATGADFFHLAIVPDQTVTTATFDVQAIAENIDPASPLSAPIVIDSSGGSHTMVLTTLQWPGTATNSVSIWSATIPLLANQVNAIRLLSGSKEIDFSIRHKPGLNVVTVANSAALFAAVQAAMTDPTVDVVEANYNEPSLGTVLNNVGNGVTSTRTTWLTVRPAAGKTATVVTDSGEALVRPMVDYLNLDGVIYGSHTSDGGGAQLYTELNRHVWLSNVQFRAKYKFTWAKATPITANYLARVRDVGTEGQKTYYTGCTWDGTASTEAISYAELARDLQFDSHRGDINNFGRVVLNVVGQDLIAVRNFTNTDFLHNDIFQIWGNVQTSNLVFKGVRITSPNIAAEIQPFFFDSSFTPNYSNVLVDNISIVGGTNALKAQFAGVISSSRISNISLPAQSVTIRQDFGGASAAFAPTNVRIQNFDIKAVDYIPSGGGGTTFSIANANIANSADISSELLATGSLSGATFSVIGLVP
jgi:hypothetical protein